MKNALTNAMCAAIKKVARPGKGKKDQQANAANALAGLLRSNALKMKCSEAAALREVRSAAVVDKEGRAVTEGAREGHVADVVLITEGLGNRRNMNYYGPEAITGAPAVFEGKPCFLDHPSESEERDIPERRVRQKCGYFKNCRVENIEGSVACVGELHFDLSEDGEQAYRKACTALHYKGDFPGGGTEYVGLSINADGDVEDRTVQWQGETLQVNYVTQFRDAMSCDIVTSPARGGRFLALVESAAGAKPTQEVGPMKKGLKKALEAAQTALAEADKEKDLKAKAEKVTEANKLFQAFLKEAAKAAYQDESEDGEAKEKEAGEDEAGEDEGESEGDSHTVTKHTVVKKTWKAAVPEAEDEDEDDDKDNVESEKREIIGTLAKEAGLALSSGKLARLGKLTLKEAKEEIADLKGMQESIVKSVVKQIKVPVAQLARVSESARESGGDQDKDFLVSCIQ